MPIQYSPFPEFQVPNLNVMGAYAQGAALQQQQLQEERLRQQMELAERAAGYTANKDIREAAKLQSEQAAKDFELTSKKYDSLIDMVPRLNEKNYGAWHKQVTETFPLAAATLPPTYDPEAVKFLGLKGADLKDQVLAQHVGDTTRFVRIGQTGPARPVEGSEVSAPTQWEPIKQGDFIIGYKSKYGTQQITPEEFQSLSQRQKRSEGPSTQDVAAYINQRAPQMGVDPRVANRVFTQGEYGGKYVGDQGSSFGPTQLHYGGMAPGGNRVAGLGDEFTKATGLDARDPSTWREQIDFSLGQAAKGGWGPWHAAKKVGVGEYEGINAMAPRQVASAGPMNGMLAPPAQLPSAAPQQPQTAAVRPQLKSYVPAPIGTEEASDQKSALKFLNAIEYNPETGNTRPGTLIESAGGGRPTQILYGLARALGVSTEGTRAEAGLSSSQINTLLAKVGSLGGKSFTDEDRKVVKEGLGGLDDTAVPIGDRLAKFDEAIRLMTNVAGVPYKSLPQLERLKGLATPVSRGQAGEAPKAKPLTGRIKFMELGD
jgi:hypothetical protein